MTSKSENSVNNSANEKMRRQRNLEVAFANKNQPFSYFTPVDEYYTYAANLQLHKTVSQSSRDPPHMTKLTSNDHSRQNHSPDHIAAQFKFLEDDDLFF